MRVLAEDAIGHAEAVLALLAVLAAAAVEIGVDGHPIAHLHVLDGGADLGDVARDVTAAPERHGQLQAGQTLAHEEIEMVEGGGFDAHQHVAVAGLGIGDVLVLELVDAAVLVEREGLHAGRLSPLEVGALALLPGPHALHAIL